MKTARVALALTVVLAMVLSCAVALAAEAEEQYVQATAPVNVRTGPGMDYYDMGQLQTGEELTYMGFSAIDDQGITWYQVQYYSYGVGWVSSMYSQIVYEAVGASSMSGSSSSSSAPNSGYSAPVYGSYVQATGGQSNLRSGPGLGYEDIGTMHLGDIATYLDDWSEDERGVIWYYVSFNGKIGWVSSRYTTLVPYSDYNGYDYDEQYTYDSYVRATSRVNVRTGPGLDYDDMGTLVAGEQVLYLGYSAIDEAGYVWYQVQYYSFGVGWVSSVYSEVVYGGSAGVSDNTKNNVNTNGSYVEATKGNSNLRTGPGLDYDDIGTMHKGDTATFLGNTSVDERGVTWYYVNFNGDIGWVSSRYTKLH